MPEVGSAKAAALAAAGMKPAYTAAGRRSSCATMLADRGIMAQVPIGYRIQAQKLTTELPGSVCMTAPERFGRS